MRGKIREIVKDPDGRRDAARRRNVIGCKRLCVDTGYYDDLQPAATSRWSTSATRRSSASPPHGLRANGKDYALDCLVLATGFDAMTGALLRDRHPRPRRRARCRTSGREGPRTYLGLAMAGFPNLFTITGPGSPSVLTNMLPSIEQHVELDRRLHRLPARAAARP